MSLWLALLLAACAGKADGSETTGVGPGVASGMGPGISVAEALAFRGEGPVLVSGWLWRQGEGDVRLCSALTDAVPPRCEEPSLSVRGLDLSTRGGLRKEQGTTWSQQQAQVLGDVKGGVLTVAPLSKS